MKNSKLKISVILPYFNASETLGRAIKSIEDQTYGDFECILVNNNSTDDSEKIAKSFAVKDHRFIPVCEKQSGVAFASNRGASLARGEYIARMDADDISMPERLEKEAAFLDHNPDYGAVAGLAEYIPHREGTEGFKRYVDWSNEIRSYKDIINRQFVEMPLINPTAMWRKSVSDKLGMYKKGDFPEDYEMWLRWLAAGIKIRKLPEPVLKWHDSDQRLTRTKPEYSDKSFYRIKSYYLVKWLAGNNPFHPEVLVWGASKISRRRAKLAEKHGIYVKAYIDIKKNRDLDREVIYYTNIPPAGTAFILIYMKQRKARREIMDYLESGSWIEGKNYLLVS